MEQMQMEECAIEQVQGIKPKKKNLIPANGLKLLNQTKEN